MLMQVQQRRKEAGAEAAPRRDQDEEFVEPLRYTGPHFETVAMFYLVLFLTWALVMLMLRRAEQDDRLYRLLEDQIQRGHFREN